MASTVAAKKTSSSSANKLKDNALMNEAVVEHASAKDLNVPIKAMDADDEMFDAKVTVLGYIDHHVKEEHKQVLMAGKR